MIKHFSLVFQMNLSRDETVECSPQRQTSEDPSRKAREKKRRRRARRRKKSVSHVKNGTTEAEETTSSPARGHPSSGEQRLRAEDVSRRHERVQRHQKDATSAEAQTHTRKHKFTQTQVVFQKNQETQTDFRVTTGGDAQSGPGGPAETQQTPDGPGPDPQNAARTPLKLRERPVRDQASSGPSDVTQPEKDTEPAPSAQGVSGDGAGGKQPAVETPPHSR